MSKSCTKKRIEAERAGEFARRIAGLERTKTAAILLRCSLDTVKKIKSGDYKPGPILRRRWRETFGGIYDRYVNEEHDNARLAALEARHEALAREIAEERRKL